MLHTLITYRGVVKSTMNQKGTIFFYIFKNILCFLWKVLFIYQVNVWCGKNVGNTTLEYAQIIVK